MSITTVMVVLGVLVIGSFLFLFVLKKLRASRMAEADLLEEVKRYSDTTKSISLTGMERIMIKKALTSPQFKERIQEPKTQHLVRVAYRGLLEKIKESIK